MVRRMSAVFGLALGLMVNLWAFGRAAAQEGDPQSTAPLGYLCPSRLQLRHPERCPDQGPADQLRRLSVQGLYPAMPLPTVAVDPNLGYVPFDYLRIGEDGASLFPSVEAAVAGEGATGRVDAGFVFLSYYEEIDAGGSTVYSTERGYVRGASASAVSIPRFHGLAFRRTPDRPFGWVVSGGSCTMRTPGGTRDFTGRCYVLHSVVQIYDIEHVGDWDWYMIGPDEWIDQRMVAKVDPDPTPPQGVTGGRWIRINLYEQTVAAYENGELVYATAASTGRSGNWTQPGLFQVWARLERDTMTGGLAGTNYYYLENVPWVLYFDHARALHGTYWHNKFGIPTSRGCVNLSARDAHWLYDFASEGTWVYVWDPSGNTPTDPAVYDAGGA